MRTDIAECLLRIAHWIADERTQRGDNLRWAVQQYFYRFRFMPVQHVIEAAANTQEGAGDG